MPTFTEISLNASIEISFTLESNIHDLYFKVNVPQNDDTIKMLVQGISGVGTIDFSCYHNSETITGADANISILDFGYDDKTYELRDMMNKGGTWYIHVKHQNGDRKIKVGFTNYVYDNGGTSVTDIGNANRDSSTGTTNGNNSGNGTNNSNDGSGYTSNIDYIKSGVDSLKTSINDLSTTMNNVSTQIVNTVYTNNSIISNTIANMSASLSADINSKSNELSNNISSVGSAIQSSLTDSIQSIVNASTTISNDIISSLSNQSRILNAALNGIQSTLTDTATLYANKITDLSAMFETNMQAWIELLSDRIAEKLGSRIENIFLE